MTKHNEGDATSAARRVADAWENSTARNMDGYYVTDVRGTVVQLGHIEYGTDGNAEWVDVWFGRPDGSPAFRLVNPETRVLDRRGDIVVKTPDARGGTQTYRFRDDPLQAVAETIVDVRSGT